MSNFWNGKRRFVALLAFLAGVFVALRVPPVIPVIQLPGEKYPDGWDLPLLGLRLTNTFVGSLVVWILLIILIVFVVRRRPQDGSEVPTSGFYNFFEMIFEGLMDFVGGVAGGTYFRVIFNIFMTIFLIVLLSNWLELVPTIDSVGFIEPHVEEVYNEATGEFELETTDGYEIYPSVVGYALNGQCPFVSAEEEAALDEAAMVKADAARVKAEEEAKVAKALEEFENAHGADADHGDAEEGEHADEAATDDQAATDEHAEDTEAHAEDGPEAAYQAVLDARTAEKQARIDAGCYTGVGAVPWAEDDGHSESGGDDQVAEGDHAEGEAGHGVPSHPAPDSEEAKLVPWVVLPFWRVPSTDLNMTLSLALIAFVMIQYIGFRALGWGYLTKFFNFSTLFKSPLGGIDLAVGLLELIGDFAKILSFSFRLLGNIFAGSILLFVMSFLMPILPWPFFILEFFVGIIQALVFGLLTAIFMNLATVSHHHDDEHEGAH